MQQQLKLSQTHCSPCNIKYALIAFTDRGGSWARIRRMCRSGNARINGKRPSPNQVVVAEVGVHVQRNGTRYSIRFF